MNLLSSHSFVDNKAKRIVLQTSIIMAQPTHVLYHHPFSVCSIMVRYTFALRGAPGNEASEIRLEERVCDILRGEQLSEHYLCDINANGEVPVLVPDISESSNGQPIPESVDITYYIANQYPSLLPKEHEDEIKRLLEALHHINFFSLTFTGKQDGPRSRIAQLQRLLQGNISDKYRVAIERKIQRCVAPLSNANRMC